MLKKLTLTCACVITGVSVSFAGGSGMGGYVHKSDTQNTQKSDAHQAKAESRMPWPFNVLAPREHTDQKMGARQVTTRDKMRATNTAEKSNWPFNWFMPKEKANKQTASTKPVNKNTQQTTHVAKADKAAMWPFNAFMPKAKKQETAMKKGTESSTKQMKKDSSGSNWAFNAFKPRDKNAMKTAQKSEKPAFMQKTTTMYVDKDAALHPHEFKAGPYVGFSIGPIEAISGVPVVYQGLEGTLSAGFGRLWDRFYLALEGFAGDSADMRNHTNGAADIRTTWSFGGDVLPGMMLTDTVLGYFRLGGLVTKFQGPNKNVGAWQVGLGGQTNLYKNLDIRGEYIYSQYSETVTLGIPRTNQFNLGLVLKFV